MRFASLIAVAIFMTLMLHAQGVSTTTVQGTVYLANGQAGSGTLEVQWPSFTTAAGQAVAAASITVQIPEDGFVSVSLAPNQGSTPAGEYYTAVYYLSDGSTSTEYWIVPAAPTATLAQVRSQVMPAAQAVQAVNKAYVDQSISELSQSLITASGGNLTGPLYLNGDPMQTLQAADKHYVDAQVATAVPLAGGIMTGALSSPTVNGVQAPSAGSAQTTLQAAVTAAGTNGAMQIPPSYAGTDSFTNPNGVRVTDLRTSGAQQTERSVKEFGAICDGATDDTVALQAALNYANVHGVALTIPQGTCKTHTLSWHGESIGGPGKQVSALMGFPGQDVLASAPDSVNILSNTRLHDLTIYVDQSVDVSCAGAQGRAPAGICQISRLIETNSIFSSGGNGLTGTRGTGAGWAVGNCAIAMPASTGAGGNGLKVAVLENVTIATTGTDPLAAQYPGAHSTHTCGMYLAQWPQWSEFHNINISGVNTAVAIPALPGSVPAGLNADSNHWQDVTIQAAHAFTAAAGSNNVLDNVVALISNSAATSEPPTGLVMDFSGNQQGWTARNAVVLPTWNAVQPGLTVSAASGAVGAVSLGGDHGLGWDPYGLTVPIAFSGSCTAQATATVNADGSIGAVSVTQGGVGCSTTTTASVKEPGTWDTSAPVNLISGQNMSFFAGNLLKGNGGYTVWNATSSKSYGTQLDGGGGTLPAGGTYAALVGSGPVGNSYDVDQFPGVDFGAKLQACINGVSANYGGTCDARNFTGNLALSSNLTISNSNTTVLLPCATITTANQVVITAGTRNVSLRGCALRGGSAANGSAGGTAFAYSGAGAMIQVGDTSYATDTPGFHMDNAVINTTASASASTQGIAVYRTQELDLESLYLLGNANQTGVTLDGTGNYSGGTFLDDQIDGFQTAINAIGHRVANGATTDWVNASTFVRMHIDCPTSSSNPIAGTYGINLQQGDGNTFTGGDIEGCATALHLGANAQNNTIVGLRNENSTTQVVADAGSSYNNWMSGGTMFTGQLTDNGTRNSFLDTFHRSFNGLNGDWYGSQQDATLTNHYRLGIGAGNERGLQERYQTDFGYRWTMGLSDATGGEQYYQILDELNNVYRFSIGQYNNGQSSTNNQTVLNSAGTGAVVLNGSNGAGTGGVVFGSGGMNSTTVGTIGNTGNAQFNGTLQAGGTTQSAGTVTVRNNADAEVDYYLWPGLTTSQKGSFTYKDWNGNSQWYLLKDASNNWSLNSALSGLDSFKAYQSTNSGDTYIDASNSSGIVRVNYETGAGSGFKIYGGNSSALYASFTGASSIAFPGLAAGSGHNCLQIDNSGYITNTGSACGSGSGSGTVGTGNNGQIAYYTGTGTSIGGMSAVPLTAGGTGASSAAAALANLGAQAALPGVSSDGNNGVAVTGNVAASKVVASSNTAVNVQSSAFAASCNWVSYAVSMTASSNIVTRQLGPNFTSALVGQKFFGYGYGPSHSNLITTVTGFTDASHITVAVNASESNLSGWQPAWIGSSDDTTALQNAYITAGVTTQQVGIQAWGYTNNATSNVDWPTNAVCAISSTLWAAGGVTTRGNGATLLELTDTDALAYDYTSCAEGAVNSSYCTTSTNGYGYNYGGIHDLTIYGPGPKASTHAGIRLQVVVDFDESNVQVLGFKYGQQNGEVQYTSFNKLYFENNMVGLYETTQAAQGKNATAVAVSGSTGAYTVTVTVPNIYAAGNTVALSNCTGSYGTQLNGTIDTLTTASSTQYQFTSTATSLATGSSSDTCVSTYMPSWATGLTTLDNQYSNIVSKDNEAYGYWGQTTGSSQFTKTDFSYNSGADLVLGAQLAPYWYFPSSTASGGTCTASSNLPITFTGGTYQFPIQAYVTTNGSGNATGVVVTDGGYYQTGTATPTMNVAGCTVQPTLPTLALWNDAGLGIYSGANGQQTTRRGGMEFDLAKSENSALPDTLGNPNRGYMIVIDGQPSGPTGGYTFNSYNTCVGNAYSWSTRGKLLYLTNNGSTVTFNDPLCPQSGIGYSANPGSVFGSQSGLYYGFNGSDNAVISNASGSSLILRVGSGLLSSGVSAQSLITDVESGYPSGSGVFRAGSAGGENVSEFNSSGAQQSAGFGAIASGTYAGPGNFFSRYLYESQNEFYCGVSGTAAGNPICGFGSGTATPDVTWQRTGTGQVTWTAANGFVVKGPFENANGVLLPSTLSGYHGTSGVKVQLSDGTGQSGGLAGFASDGSVTNASAHNDAVVRICNAAGSSNTFTCATSPAFTPAAGDELLINFTSANTGSATLNVNSTAADPIYKNGGTATLASGDIQANHWVSAILDSNNHWQLEGQLGQVNATELNGAMLSGLSTGILKNTTSTGVPSIAVAGTDYVAPNGNITGTASNLSGTPTLPNGTLATTQSAGDNSTKLATTAYVASPGAITPTTVTASGIITGSNDTTRTTTTTMTNAWTTTGLVLPTVPVSTTKNGRCVIFWQMSSTSYTAAFGLGMNNAPTDVWGATKVIYNVAGSQNYLSFTQASTSTAAISTAATAGATGTTYEADVDFTIQTGSNPVAMTIYGETSNSGATLTIEPGSECHWLP